MYYSDTQWNLGGTLNNIAIQQPASTYQFVLVWKFATFAVLILYTLLYVKYQSQRYLLTGQNEWQGDCATMPNTIAVISADVILF